MPAPHATVPCHFCTHPVHPGAVGTYERISGWGEYREGGGMNAVRMPEHHREFAHRTCVDRATKGHRRGQTSLEEVAPAEAREELHAEEETLPIYDGTQEGMTGVSCPHRGCDHCSTARRMPAHLETHKEEDGVDG